MRSPIRRNWSPEDISRLNELLHMGISMISVPRKLQRSRSSIRAKMLELGLQGSRGSRGSSPTEEEGSLLRSDVG